MGLAHLFQIDCLLPTKCYYYYYTFQNDAIHFTTTVIHPMTKQKYIEDISLTQGEKFQMLGQIAVYFNTCIETQKIMKLHLPKVEAYRTHTS